MARHRQRANQNLTFFVRANSRNNFNSFWKFHLFDELDEALPKLSN